MLEKALYKKVVFQFSNKKYDYSNYGIRDYWFFKRKKERKEEGQEVGEEKRRGTGRRGRRARKERDGGRKDPT